jgi:hypothetical protein
LRGRGILLSESGNLDYLGLKKNLGKLEALSNNSAVGKKTSNCSRLSISYNIKIFRLLTQQQISYAAAYQISRVTKFVKTLNYFEGVFVGLR